MKKDRKKNSEKRNQSTLFDISDPSLMRLDSSSSHEAVFDFSDPSLMRLDSSSSQTQNILMKKPKN